MVGRPANPRLDLTSLFWNPDDPVNRPTRIDMVVDGVSAAFSIMDTIGDGHGDEGSVWDDYLKRKSRYIGFKGDITSEVSDVHTVQGRFRIPAPYAPVLPAPVPVAGFGRTSAARDFRMPTATAMTIYGNRIG